MLRFHQISCLKRYSQFNGCLAARFSAHSGSDAEKMIQRVLEVNATHPEWKTFNRDRKLLPMIANSLSSMKRFEELDRLFDKVGIDCCSLGMQTTLLRSYIERQNWESAIGLLENLEGKLKHTRLHHELVQNLCSSNKVNDAFHHFKALVGKESLFKFKRSYITAQETFEAILEIMIKHTHGVSDEVLATLLKYIQFVGASLNPSNMKNIEHLLLLLDYECKHTTIDDPIILGGLQSNLHEKSFIRELQDMIEKQLIENGGHSFLKTLRGMKKEAYIIDVANVLYQTEKQNKPNILRLRNIVNSLITQNQQGKGTKNVIFVVPRGGSSRKLHLVNYLHHLKQEFIMTCSIDLISNQKVDDDLLILYLALLSPNKSIIISHDQFTEHLALISESERLNMISWLRSTIKSFDGDGQVELSKYPPSVIINERTGVLCFIDNENNILYAKKHTQ